MAASKPKSTEFSCHSPDAGAVFLAGTFNDWRTDATPMTKDDHGTWKANLKLPVGRHEFKFVVDGQWCCEPNCNASGECPKCVSDEFGTMNRFVEVA